MDRRRRYCDAAPAAPRDPPAALLRRIRSRGPAPGTAVPGRGRKPGAHPGGPGRKLAITVEPLRELTASQRRQLGDEVDLVAAVMEAPATLTVGTVTVGAHA